jgi:hypothetical protein
MNKDSVLINISVYSSMIPISIGIYLWKKLVWEMKILLVLFIFGFATDMTVTWMPKDARWPYWLEHVYVLIELILVMVILISWQKSQYVGRLFQILIGLYILFWVFAKFTYEPFNTTFYLTGSMSSVVLALCAGYTFLLVIGDQVQTLFHDYRFWILLPFVLYFTGRLMPVALQIVLFHHSREDLYLVWSINWVIAIISNILFSIGFTCPQTRT